MPRVIFSAQAQYDIHRLYTFLVAKDVLTAQRAVLEIDCSIKNQLAKNPLIYRGITCGLREYIIDFGNSGYIVLFDYNSKQRVIEILAVRHQLEDDYKYTSQ